MSELETQSIPIQAEERGGAEQNIWQSKKSPADSITTALHPLNHTVPAGVCPALSALPVIPAADPGGQHDLPLPPGHPAALACGPPPALPGPGLQPAAGGGRRCRPAEIPGTLPGEQPPPLGECTAAEGLCPSTLCCFSVVVLFSFLGSTGASSPAKQSGRCRSVSD